MWKWSGTITSKRTVPRGEISHLCARRKTSLTLSQNHHNSAVIFILFYLFLQITQATKRKFRQPKLAWGVHVIKSQTGNSPRICVSLNPCIIKFYSPCPCVRGAALTASPACPAIINIFRRLGVQIKKRKGSDGADGFR